MNRASEMRAVLLLIILGIPSAVSSGQETRSNETLSILFIGNSYTARHRLVEVVKAMAEEGNPGMVLKPTAVIYGGRRLVDHWRLGTQNIVNRHKVTKDEVKATIGNLAETVRKNPDDRHSQNAITRQTAFLNELEEDSESAARDRWDVIVLQSYRDDLEGADSLYAQYARRFAELARAQGAKIILYETTPTTQNAEPLTTPPERTVVMKKAVAIAALADQIDANVAPMSLVGLQCQSERPDLTLRFINDAHLNQTMAYLTACAIYAALFERSPEGLKIDSVTDIRFWQNKNRERDRDNQPITKKFDIKDRSDLQRIVWKAYQDFQGLRSR